MSLFNHLKQQNNTVTEPEATAAGQQAPAERKSLLEIAREAQAREQAEAAAEAAEPAAENELEPEAVPHPMDYYSVKLKKGETDLLDSKLGGTPYWERTKAYPRDENGVPMRLLLQLNFDRLALKDNRLPQQGILQFFIASTPRCRGKVIYHPHAEATPMAGTVPVMPSEEGFSPVKAPALVTLQRENTEASPEGHKVFGTPAFCQGDPRDGLPEAERSYYDTLLLQLDSDFNSGDPLILWGDSGVGNFFINAQALQNKDFSKTLFYWDCY